MADELTPADFPQGELLFYTSKDGKVKMEIRVEDETIWMSQQMMAELFQTTKQNVAKHLKRIFEQDELQEESVVNYWGQAQTMWNLNFHITMWPHSINTLNR